MRPATLPSPKFARRSEGLSDALPHMLQGRPLVSHRQQAADLRHWENGGRSNSAPPGAGPMVRAATSSGLRRPSGRPRRLPGTSKPMPDGPAGIATEAEWEFAARGGLTARNLAGVIEQRLVASTWRTPGTAISRTRTSRPMASAHFARHCIPGQRLRPARLDWQCLGMTADWYSQKHEADAPKGVLHSAKSARRGLRPRASTCVSRTSGFHARCSRAASHLCAPNYCRRYRPAARSRQPIDTSASHVGFSAPPGRGSRHE